MNYSTPWITYNIDMNFGNMVALNLKLFGRIYYFY